MIEIQQVSFREVLDDDLLGEYEQECALAELLPVNPNFQTYEALEKAGSLTAFGAYFGQVLVGFATIMLYEVPHYSKKVATAESLFVSSHYRKYGVGTALLSAIREYSREHGASAMFFSAPFGSDFHRLMETSKGFRRAYSVYLGKL